MTDKIDEDGYFVSDKHFIATFHFDGLQTAEMRDFLPGLAILGRLDVRKYGPGFEVDFRDTSRGVSGTVCADRVRLTFEVDAKRA